MSRASTAGLETVDAEVLPVRKELYMMQPKHQASLSVQEAIETRRSVRAYLPDPIDRADLEEIIRLASLAPSALNLQPWRFYVVVDPDVRRQIQAAAPGQPQVGQAPALILVASDMEDTLAHVEDVLHPSLSPELRERRLRMIQEGLGTLSVAERAQRGVPDARIALGFLLLAARAMGYATVPMTGFDHDQVRQILNLPDHVRFAAMVAIGRPAEEGLPHHRLPLDRILKFI